MTTSRRDSAGWERPNGRLRGRRVAWLGLGLGVVGVIGAALAVSGRALGVAAATLGVLASGPAPARDPLPGFAEVRDRARNSEVWLVDRDGSPVQRIGDGGDTLRLDWVTLADVSPHLVRAVIAAEDRRFAAHDGVDRIALLGALRDTVLSGHRRGASTLSMQLAALLDPAPRGASRLAVKLARIRAALVLERTWSKDQILEAYLNLVPVRGRLVGVDAAARRLARRSPAVLTPADAVVLAALLRGPLANRSVVTRRAVDTARAAGLAVDAASLATSLERILARPEATTTGPNLAPHLAQRLAGGGRATGSRRVRSTLSGGAQRRAVESVRQALLGLTGRNVHDAAVLAIDNRSGEVLVYVGSSADLSPSRFVDGVLAHRQAGSILKPFLYELALERRLLTAASPLDDSPLEIGESRGVYRPRNYDEHFRGLVSLRVALASSLNVPAVRSLALVGEDAFADRLRTLGFTGVDRPGASYGPALALGAADVSLWELVGAYRTLARGGVRGSLRISPEPAPDVDDSRVLAADAAFIVADILADRESRSPTFGLESALAPRFRASVKTGTSKDMRDNWCVGFTERFTVGAWVGNFSGAPMHDVSGVSGAAPIWLDVLTSLETGASEAAAPPTGVVQRLTQPAGTAELARWEWFVAGTEPATRPGSGSAQIVAPVRGKAPANPPEIVSPAHRSILAIDPDVPPTKSRLLLQARLDDRPATLELDGRVVARSPLPGKRKPLGQGSAPPREQSPRIEILWTPRAGPHVLRLRDRTGAVLARAEFVVRSTGSRRSSG